jgi:glycosyltransferase involved in cell wall biosynthesis
MNDAATASALDLSIIIPWRNRPELARTLRQNREAFDALRAEVLVINSGGDFESLESLVRDSEVTRLRLIDLAQDTFNKCLAQNIGAAVSRGRRLMLLDADIMVTPTLLTGMVERTDDTTFVTIEWVADSNATPRPTGLATTRQSIQLVWADGRELAFEFFSLRRSDGARGGPGLICVLKEHFAAIHGMNARLTSWGWEDMDLIIRLQAKLGLRRAQFGDAVHLAHDDDIRNLHGGTRDASNLRNMALCYQNYERGYFLGTLGRDIETSKGKVFERSTVRQNEEEPAVRIAGIA